MGQQVVISDDIFTYNYGDTEWKFLQKMKTPRAFHSSISFTAIVSLADFGQNLQFFHKF